LKDSSSDDTFAMSAKYNIEFLVRSMSAAN
jgi:hypothetical protein